MRSHMLKQILSKSFGANFQKTILENKTLVSSVDFYDHFKEFLNEIDSRLSSLEAENQAANHSFQEEERSLIESNNVLTQTNQGFSALINCLEQGFLIFDKAGVCSQVSSKACEVFLECNPNGKSILEVLKIPAEKKSSILSWIELLFLEKIDFDDLSKIGPNQYPHSQGRVINLQFKPLRDFNNRIEFIVLIVNDVTETLNAKAEAAKMHEYANLVTMAFREKAHLTRFLKYAEDAIHELDSLACYSLFSDQDLQLIKDTLHTLKGAASSFGFSSLSEVIHKTETNIVAQSNLVHSRNYLRESVDQINRVYYQTLSAHSDLFEGISSNSEPTREILLSHLKDFSTRLSTGRLSQLNIDFQRSFIGVEAERFFKRFESDLKACCVKSGKPVPQFHIFANGVSLVPEELDSVFNQFTHIFRNIAVHGIESSAERRGLGKPVQPRVSVRIAIEFSPNQSKMLVVSIEDDGRGIDHDAIRRKLIEMGRSIEAEKMNTLQLEECIFNHGFSTASSITEVAGRGVGLSSLKTELEQRGGSIHVKSRSGLGCCFEIKIPVPNHVVFGLNESNAA